MNVLIVNGSPKGDKSNTLKLTKSFVKGMQKSKSINVTEINIKTSEINHCLGCFSCWVKTPGQCVINDDMSSYIQQFVNADLVIWSFPLYYFGMPSKVKAFLDRLLPTSKLGMYERSDGGISHYKRYDLSNQKTVLITTCGFCDTKNNYEALLKQFEIIYGKDLTKVICAEGELIKIPELKSKINQYLGYVEQAGNEYAEQCQISANTQAKLSELFMPKEMFLNEINKHNL